jgi:hypothetical protein
LQEQSTGIGVKRDIDKLLKKNNELNQLDFAKVVSHVQRETDGWILNTIMLEGYDVPFKYRRKKAYRSLQGARVNLTYYPQPEQVAGLNIEVMKVVRIRRA